MDAFLSAWPFLLAGATHMSALTLADRELHIVLISILIPALFEILADNDQSALLRNRFAVLDSLIS
jgi:hypothetical protein